MTVNNLNFDYVNSTVATAVQNAEASLKAKIARPYQLTVERPLNSIFFTGTAK